VGISLAQASASVVTGALQPLAATVQNTSNTTATWQVNSITEGSTSTGTVDHL
jgi:hypothetical protein